ncbi:MULTISPECIES: type 4a pilus biogenesis protein PilO [Candidatus Ichthyocystis]|uniref:type 4a pilus biogenesis protein PilO n=1 Tax=Candidatus Ichthyocystis TaxID=2929841 RepID=UPI000B84D713|nr:MULTISPECIES: type 4a pilus biogenesis protein PilO [Ichthyocystis]
MFFDNIDISSLGYAPLKWPKSVRVASVLILCVIVFCVYYLFFAMSMVSSYSAMELEEKSLKSNYSARRSSVINLEEYKNYYEYLESSFGELIKQFPKESQIKSLLNSLNKIGVSNNMTFCSFVPEKKVKKDLYIEQPVSIDMAGSYNDFANFVYQVVLMDKVVVLGDLSISVPGSVGSANGGSACGRSLPLLKPGKLLFSFTATIYEMIGDKKKSSKDKKL